MKKQRWQDWLLIIGGIWLFVAPWALGTSSDAASSWNAWIVGAAVVGTGWWALARPTDETPEWIQGLFAVWVFITPWVLGFGSLTAAAWNAWLVGGAVLALAVWAFGDIQQPRRSEAGSTTDHPLTH